MKMLHVPASSLIARLFQSFVLILVFTFYSPTYSSGQTLFEIAVELDSLADQIKADSSTAAVPFFNAFKKVYAFEGDFKPLAIKEDVKGNRYLEKIVNFAYQRSNFQEDDKDEQLSKLSAEKDTAFNIFYSLLDQACQKDYTNCSYKDQLYKMQVNRYDYGDQTDDLDKFLKDNKLPKVTEDTLKKIVLKISSIELQLSELNQANASQFTQSDQASEIMPVSSSPAAPAFAPIIIQQQGGGSAQSAIIDGTAKWIAERMRQELSVAFFDRFENWAEEKSISHLFPNTLAVLQTSANTDYTLLMEVYKNAFDKDLNQLIFNLPAFLEKELVNGSRIDNLWFEIASSNYTLDSIAYAYKKRGLNDNYENPFRQQFDFYKLQIESGDTLVVYKSGQEIEEMMEQKFSQNIYFYRNENYDKFYKNSDEFKVRNAFKYINFTLEAIKQLKDGSHPSTLLTYLNNNIEEVFPHNPDLKASLLLLDVLSQGLTKVNDEKNTVWIGKKEIQKLRDDAQFRSIFFGLIDYKIKQIIRAEKQALEYNKSFFSLTSETGYAQQTAIREMKEYKEWLFFDFCKYARGPIIKNRKSEKDLLFSWTWESILDDYIPSDSTFIYKFDITKEKENLSEILSAYNQELLYVDSSYDFYLENYARDMEVFKNDVKNVKDTIRSVSDEVYQYDTTFTIHAALEYLDYLYLAPDKDLFDKELYASLDTTTDGYSSFLDYAGESLSYFEKSSDDWDNTIFPAVKRLVQERIEIYKKYEVYTNLFDTKEKQLFKKYYKYRIQPDSITMVIQHNGSVKGVVTTDMELSLLKETQEILDYLILNKSQQKRFGKIVNSFIQFSTKIDNINSELKALRNNDNGNFGKQEFFYLVKSSVDALDLVLDLAINDPRTYQNIKFVTNNLLDAYQSALNKDYNGLVMNVIPVVQKIVLEKYQPRIDSLVQQDLRRHGLTEFQIIDLPNNPERDSLQLILDNKMRKMQEVFKYATFAAAIAESNGSEDVKNAINAIALPVGSYSIKRRTYANISLNAYPGITGGFELVQNNNFSEWAPNFGFTAPIGIGVNWGYRAKINKNKYYKNLAYQKRIQRSDKGIDEKVFSGHSGSLFFSFVDLGALVLFRLNDSNEPLPEDVGIKQIFSPGVAYVHGLPRVPVSIMIGAQMTPNLRKIGEGENQESANSFRFNLSFVVDLPIANFHTRRRPKR